MHNFIWFLYLLLVVDFPEVERVIFEEDDWDEWEEDEEESDEDG